MNFHLYLACFGVALVGMALQTVLKLKSLQDKARAGNIKFNVWDYFRNDWLSIIASVLTIVLFLIIVDNLLKWKPVIINYVKIGFAFVGYVGSDIASRLFSVVNRKINSIIDAKTDTADGLKFFPTTFNEEENKKALLTTIPKTKIE